MHHPYLGGVEVKTGLKLLISHFVQSPFLFFFFFLGQTEKQIPQSVVPAIEKKYAI